MAQKTLTVHVVTIYPFKKYMFRDFLSIDGDFSENEESFREDTIESGFENESERISVEYNNKFTKKWQSEEDTNDEYFTQLVEYHLEELANISIKGNEFILGNKTYTSDYNITVVQIDPTDYNKEITVVISYIG
jgi:hypothetical protein